MGRNIFSPSVFTSRQNNTMKLAVVFIVLTAFALAQAKKCNLKGGQCVEFYTGMIVGPTGPQLPKPDCQKCRADAVARSVTEPKCFIPACKPKKPNEFMRYQYDPNAGTGKGAKKGQSFCYTIYGVEIRHSRRWKRSQLQGQASLLQKGRTQHRPSRQRHQKSQSSQLSSLQETLSPDPGMRRCHVPRKDQGLLAQKQSWNSQACTRPHLHHLSRGP